MVRPKNWDLVEICDGSLYGYSGIIVGSLQFVGSSYCGSCWRILCSWLSMWIPSTRVCIPQQVWMGADSPPYSSSKAFWLQCLQQCIDTPPKPLMQYPISCIPWHSVITPSIQTDSQNRKEQVKKIQSGYPLVNVYITTENPSFLIGKSTINDYKSLIFNSGNTVPKGICYLSNHYPSYIVVCPWFVLYPAAMSMGVSGS